MVITKDSLFTNSFKFAKSELQIAILYAVGVLIWVLLKLHKQN